LRLEDTSIKFVHYLNIRDASLNVTFVVDIGLLNSHTDHLPECFYYIWNHFMDLDPNSFAGSEFVFMLLAPDPDPDPYSFDSQIRIQIQIHVVKFYCNKKS
jgi:hypothetical protein